jgi:acetyltransferase-like isoleucine patch superfamily enzyme
MNDLLHHVATLRALFARRLHFRKSGGTTVARDVHGLRDAILEGENHVGRSVRFRGRVEIGRRTTIGRGCTFDGQISIGRYCMLGPDTAVCGRNHPLTHLSTSTNPALLGGMLQRYSPQQPVRIGHDVWTGCRALVLSGVEVGNGAVVGAGAVVTKAVPAYAIVVGAPGRVVGYRIDTELIPLVEKLRWWEMADDELEDIRWLFEMDLITQKDAALRRLRTAVQAEPPTPRPSGSRRGEDHDPGEISLWQV